MSLASVQSRFRENVKYHGWFAAAEVLVLAFVRKFIRFERIYLYSFGTIPVGMVPMAGQSIRLAKSDEMKELLLDPTFDLNEFGALGIDQRFKEGHLCALNVCDEKRGGYSWMRLDGFEIPRINLYFKLRPNEGFTYKGYTHPKFRGRRMANDRYLFWLGKLREMGRNALLCDFAFENKATLTRVKHLGLKKLGTATFVAVGPFRKLFLTGDFRGREHRPI